MVWPREVITIAESLRRSTILIPLMLCLVIVEPVHYLAAFCTITIAFCSAATHENIPLGTWFTSFWVIEYWFRCMRLEQRSRPLCQECTKCCAQRFTFYERSTEWTRIQQTPLSNQRHQEYLYPTLYPGWLMSFNAILQARPNKYLLLSLRKRLKTFRNCKIAGNDGTTVAT